MFAQVFKNPDDILRRETDCSIELGNTGQSSSTANSSSISRLETDGQRPDTIECKISETTISDDRVGSAGFLREAFDFFKTGMNFTTGRPRPPVDGYEHSIYYAIAQLCKCEWTTISLR